jgi:3-dehydroquinate synthase
MRTVSVDLGSRAYRIHVGQDLLPDVGPGCRRLKLGRRCAVMADEHLLEGAVPVVMESLTSAGFTPVLIPIPSGETSKSLEQVQRCYRELAGHRLERGSFIVAMGGGVVGDLAGFAAATYLRGIPFIQVPTTLLAQVDSSVGGKVGINLPEGKNLVGAFHQPRWVLCDLDTLRTLPDREYRSGLAEIIKYGIIADARLFSRLETDMPALLRRDPTVLERVVARSCRIKADVVTEDETESGRRAILNFGHTVGHALEAISRYGRYLHGEAISIGQVVAAWLSMRHAGMPVTHVERITRLFDAAGLPTTVSLPAAERDALFQAMSLDKKVQAGEVKFVLSPRIGATTWGHPIPRPDIEAALGKAGLAAALG